MSLAEWGRKEISIAEREMPGLMSIRKKIRDGQAARGRAHHRLAAHDGADGGAHRDAGGAGRDRALGELQCFPPKTQRRRDQRAFVFAWKGETLEEYWDCTLKPSAFSGGLGPLVVDDGGDDHAAHPQGL